VSILKNLINYYYSFYVSDIHYVDGKYFFTYLNSNYMFRPFFGDSSLIDAVYELDKQISFSNPFFHKIILNKDKSAITYVDNKPYILCKLSNVSRDSISIFDIKGNDYVIEDKKTASLNLFNWIYLWENKIDYFEHQILSNFFQYHFILPTFYYFVGLSENAIQYVRLALESFDGDSSDRLVVSHRRFYKSTTLIDFYDPLNLVLDHKTRDVSEYIKFLFFDNNYDLDVINDYLGKLEMSKLGVHLLFGRLLFPSFYFDVLEDFFNTGNSELIVDLDTYIHDYQIFLKEIYFMLNKKYGITEVNWLIKD